MHQCLLQHAAGLFQVGVIGDVQVTQQTAGFQTLIQHGFVQLGAALLLDVQLDNIAGVIILLDFLHSVGVMVKYRSHAVKHPLHLIFHTLPGTCHSALQPHLCISLAPLLQFLQCFVANVHPEVASQRHRSLVDREPELVGDLFHLGVLVAVEHGATLKRLLADLHRVDLHEGLHQLVEASLEVGHLLLHLKVDRGRNQPTAIVIPRQCVLVEPNACLTTQRLDRFQRGAIHKQVLVNRRCTLAAGTLVVGNFLLNTFVLLTSFPDADIQAAKHGGSCNTGEIVEVRGHTCSFVRVYVYGH